MNATNKQAGKRIGKFTVEKVLGRGAMGVVYLARDPQIQRLVAIKTIALPAGLEEEQVQEYRERFLREARAAGRLNHSAIVTIYECDGGEWGGPPFIAMEYIEGVPWNVKIRKEGPPEILRVIQLARDVASSLDYAHSQGIVHRDIKPANIIETPTGHAKLMDFGIAKVPTSELTREGQFLGTPAYMSPEQVMGKPVDGRSDLFSFGTVLYELLTKKKPFPGDEITTVTHKILREEPPRPARFNEDIPAEVEAIVLQLLEKDPDRRYQTAAQLMEDLDAFLGNAPPPHAMHQMAAHSTQVAAPEKPETPKQPVKTEKAGKKAPASRPAKKTKRSVPKGRKPLYIGIAAITALVVIAGALFAWSSYLGFLHRIEEESPLVGPYVRSLIPDKVRVPLPPKEVVEEALAPPRVRQQRIAYYVPPELTAKEPAETNTGPETPVQAAPKPCRLSYTFTTKVLKGEFWLRIDGQVMAHKVIQRSFTFKSETYQGTVEVPPGNHEVQFEVKTTIQDIHSQHKETVVLPEGGAKRLLVEMSKMNKDISFEWQ